MKKKEFKEIKNKPALELQKELETMRARLNDLRFDLSAGKVKNIREIRAVRRSIAQLLTVIKVQLLNPSTQGGSPPERSRAGAPGRKY